MDKCAEDGRQPQQIDLLDMGRKFLIGGEGRQACSRTQTEGEKMEEVHEPARYHYQQLGSPTQCYKMTRNLGSDFKMAWSSKKPPTIPLPFSLSKPLHRSF